VVPDSRPLESSRACPSVTGQTAWSGVHSKQHHLSMIEKNRAFSPLGQLAKKVLAGIPMSLVDLLLAGS